MAKKAAAKSSGGASVPASRLKSSSLLDTRVVYCGDNLERLAKLPDACVDLIYIDPPFKSNRDYNLLFKSPKGHESEAQITAFEDSWHWGEQAEREFDELVHAPNTDVSEMMQALRRFLGENDMMAYLTMMANRLLQLHRVPSQRTQRPYAC
jgi:site-specific DNA-methyltransferase (adenine-specific)